MTFLTTIFVMRTKNYVGRIIISLQTISTCCFLRYCAKKTFTSRDHALFSFLPVFFWHFNFQAIKNTLLSAFFSASKFFPSLFSPNKQWVNVIKSNLNPMEDLTLNKDYFAVCIWILKFSGWQLIEQNLWKFDCGLKTHLGSCSLLVLLNFHSNGIRFRIKKVNDDTRI